MTSITGQNGLNLNDLIDRFELLALSLAADKALDLEAAKMPIRIAQES